MRRIRGVWILSVFVVGCVPVGAEIGGSSGGQALIGADMVPDPTYHPRIGDRSVLYAIEEGTVLERLPLLKDVTAYDIYVRSLQAKDAERLFELQQQGWLQWVDPGTRVLVLGMQDRQHIGAHTASQVRITDDAHKNQSFWTPSNYIARMIHKEPE
jgi:hypothetical protein